MRKQKYFTETLFNNLPTGLPNDALKRIVDDFRIGDMKFKDVFIRAHIRLVTSVALAYGFQYNRNDELIGIATLELCKYPQRIAAGKLIDDNVISYLLSRIHTVCRDYVRNDSVLRVPSSSIVHRGKKKLDRWSLPEYDDPEEVLYSTPSEDNDFMLDLMSCIVTERERLIITLTLAGFSDKEIAAKFECSLETIEKIKTSIFKAYKLRSLDTVQTFLPYSDFEKCAQCLEDKRLGKQRVECLQLLEKKYTAHPASKMWRGYEYQLAAYGIEICCEWLDRGYNDTCLEKIAILQKKFVDNGMPFWLKDERVHSSHRSNLLKKNWEFYFQCGWTEHPNIPYYWPVQ